MHMILFSPERIHFREIYIFLFGIKDPKKINQNNYRRNNFLSLS